MTTTAAPKKRGKIRPTLTDAPALPPKRQAPALIADLTPPAPAEPVKDWTVEPDLRALACMLSFDTGWMAEPRDIVWLFDPTTKLLQVKRPESSQSTCTTALAIADGAKADAIILNIRTRYGAVVARKVEEYVRPAPPTIGDPLPRGAVYLRRLAERTVQAGASQAQIEIALLDMARYCVEIVRAANIGDPSPSAATTRSLAAGGILELVNPAPR